MNFLFDVFLKILEIRFGEIKTTRTLNWGGKDEDFADNFIYSEFLYVNGKSDCTSIYQRNLF